MQTKNETQTTVNRREFMKTSAVSTSGALAMASSFSLPFTSAQAQSLPVQANGSGETIKYSACLVNCGSRCPLKVHVKDGAITRISSETIYDDSTFGQHQIRPCLRGRSVKWRTYNPDRIKYPMRRVGKRGEGKFERISWDEATTILANQLKQTVEKYGNEAVYYQYGSGTTGANLLGRNACQRFLSLYGGFLSDFGTYSYAQLSTIAPLVYGGMEESLLTQIQHSDLVVLFGNNMAETRMSGGGQLYETLNALEKSKAKVIMIDPRYTDSTTLFGAEWIPILPGTDGALIAALVYVLIQEGLTDEEFLKKYCIGWDESTLPASAAKNGSYKDYILGNGDDKTAKTPEWASRITGVSAKRIVQLAKEIGQAKAAWIAPGWGLQRTSNGEQVAKAVMLLPAISGHIGRPGTTPGGWGGNIAYPVVGYNVPNPVKTKIPTFLWTDAVVRGTELTAKNAHIRGKDKLDTNIKFMWNYASNVMMNQHSDLNKTREIMQDESLCEFVLVWDTHMTASAKFADLLLPDVSSVEANDLINNSYASGAYSYLIRLQNAVDPLWECRTAYDVLAEVAEKLGFKQQYTEGRTYEQWIEHCYNLMRESNTNLPEFTKTDGMGIIDRRWPKDGEGIALKAFRDDPVANPLKTPTGKIEIFSEVLAKAGQEWELPEGDTIPAIPEYCESREGVHSTQRMKEFPLQMIGFHDKGHVHSSYFNVEMLREAVPHLGWINPIDAKARGVKSGDTIEIFNDRGRIHIQAKVTERIMPGVLAVPQGAWHKVNEQGVDVGGCINSLTTQHPSPFAKGNPQHTNLVEVKLA